MVEINDLPEKVLFNIFAFLDQESFMSAVEVCNLWNKVISDNIDFFTSYFAEEGEDEEDNAEPEPDPNTVIGPEGYSNEQKVIAEQINSFKSNQYYEMLGVSEGADDDEIRNQYRKLALLVHPDKNKAPGAQQAFQALKKAFDAIMSGGVDPDDKNTSQMVCPNPQCAGEVTVYIPAEKFKQISAGKDVGYCRVCKTQFGRVFCVHCFSAWTMTVNRELEGQLATCSVCHRQFAIQFPRPAPRVLAKQNHEKPAQKKTVVKRKKNWWE